MMSGQDSLCYTGDSGGTPWQRPAALPETTAREVLLFGGTFDPPHVGHLTMAVLAREQTLADEVWFLPAPSPPHKAGIDDETFLWRTAMVNALLQDCTGLRTMPIEAMLPRPSFSVDTVRACQTWYPNVRFSFLLGTDSLAYLPTWQGALELTERIPFLVAGRSGHPYEQTFRFVQSQLPALQAKGIEMPLLDVSSTWLRERLELGLDVCGLIPPTVLEVWDAGP